MKKLITIATILLITLFLFSGCECEHQYVSEIKVQSSCTVEGVLEYVCRKCGDTYTESLGITPHSYTETVKDPTCTETGLKTFVCEACGYTYSEEIQALGHDWEDATCQKPQTCKRCKETEGDPAPHSFSDGKCTVCGEREESFTLTDAVNKKYVNATVIMSSIDSGRVRIENTSDKYLLLNIPAGTYFVSKSPSDQNMLVTSPSTVSLSPGSSTVEYLSTACMNIHRAIPDESSAYTVGYTNNKTLQKLVRLFEENDTSYYVRQAAVWIVTDNASYYDTGTLVSNGSRVISQEDYDEADRLVALARGN